MDRKYAPLGDIKFWGDKVNKLMSHFVGIMQTLNEKKEILTQAYLDKAIEVEKILKSKMILNPGKYTL